MKKISLLIITLSVACLFSEMRVRAQVADRVVVSYVTSWSTEVPDSRTMTHINFAFGGVNSSHNGVSLWSTDRLKMLVGLKQKNPSLKVLISIGGWGAGGFSPMAADSLNRLKFAQDCKRVCTQYNLDGIDIDWEFPGNNSSGETSPADEKHNYTLLMRDLRKALGDDLLLTMASNYTPENYNFRECIQYLDFVNVMCYNMASNPNHHAALYRGGAVSKGYYTSQESVAAHISAGIPRNKLVMGMPFYGNGSLGEISLKRVNELIASGEYIEKWDDVGKVPYLTDLNGNMKVGFDNARSLEYKCDYILKQHLRGAMYWDYAQDDEKGSERMTLYNKILVASEVKENLSFDGHDMEPAGYDRYQTELELVQGQKYTVAGDEAFASDDWYADPDFLIRTDDYTFRFVPVSGKYRVTADFFDKCFRVVPLDADGELAVYDPLTGKGAMWVIGAASSVGKPGFIDGSDNTWNEDNAICVPQIADGMYQFTFKVGEQLNADLVNFKLFLQPGWGKEFSPSSDFRISTLGAVFGIGTGSNGIDAGNIFLRPNRTLKNGEIYVFTLDASNLSNVRLSVKRVNEIVDAINAPRMEVSETDSVYYTLDGIMVTSPVSGNIYIHNGRKVLIKK